MFENTTGGQPIPEPLGMHPDFTSGPGFSITVIHDETEYYLVRWCWRNRCGGVYSRSQERWTLTTPIAFEDFLKLLIAHGVITSMSCDSWEMRRWIKACRLAGS